MDDKVSKIQEIRVLLSFIRHADSEGNIDFKETLIFSDLHKIVPNGNWLDLLLYRLNSAQIIHYEEIGDDGFSSITFGGITGTTCEYLAVLVESVESEYNSLEQRITEILTFNPNQLSKKISDTKKKLDEVESLIKGNELLKPMESPLREIQQHFKSVSTVSSEYEDIYKNIIRPVQEEGRSGVKATVRWAVISIVISTALSWSISNIEKIFALINLT
ncbi:hypothetical protein JFY74_04325 [Pectobacterium carotovorum]|nr:hypothetical protein JFY74_04325 [Pectobacterium carotovorum]